MITKQVAIKKLSQSNSSSEDLAYWLSRTPEERIAAVEYLRAQYHGTTERLQRVVKITKQTQR